MKPPPYAAAIIATAILALALNAAHGQSAHPTTATEWQQQQDQRRELERQRQQLEQQRVALQHLRYLQDAQRRAIRRVEDDHLYPLPPPPTRFTTPSERFAPGVRDYYNPSNAPVRSTYGGHHFRRP